MTNNSLLTTLWMFLLPLLAVLLPISIGQRYGIYVKKRSENIPAGPIGAAAGGSLGLLAFMLAFTFQVAGGRYDKRKELLLNEISDIRTTYLYAGLVPEPFRSETRKMIVDYVDIRVDLWRDPSRYENARMRSQQILDSLWSYSEALAAQDRSSEAYSLFIASISKLVSLFNERITVTVQMRLPRIILYVLALVAFFAMMVLGYQFGISGRVSFMLNLALAITFAAVMWLIFAIDRPEAGIVKLNPAPLFTLQEQLHKR